MTYQKLLDAFLNDDVKARHPDLGLINPHLDPRLKQRFAEKRKTLDYLHDPARDWRIQFVGSHWWTSEGLYKDGDKAFSDEPTCPFDYRVKRLELKEAFQMSNCAMGYIPKGPSAQQRFTREQIEYLRPKKFEEYRVMGTKVVFALGQTVLDFHLQGTGRPVAGFSDAIEKGPIDLPDGLWVVPMPHPGAYGIRNYLRHEARRDKAAQDAAFKALIQRALAHLERRGVDVSAVSWRA